MLVPTSVIPDVVAAPGLVILMLLATIFAVDESRLQQVVWLKRCCISENLKCTFLNRTLNLVSAGRRPEVTKRIFETTCDFDKNPEETINQKPTVD